MKLRKTLLACTLALASLTSVRAQSAEGHPDWPGAGQLFVGTCYQPVDVPIAGSMKGVLGGQRWEGTLRLEPLGAELLER